MNAFSIILDATVIIGTLYILLKRSKKKARKIRKKGENIAVNNKVIY